MSDLNAAKAEAVKAAAKPGYKTTEWWATVATLVGSLTSAIAGGLPATWAAAVSGGLASAYVIGRAVVKIGAAFAAGAGVDNK